MFIMPPGFNVGDTIGFAFDSYNTAGASVTITGLAVTDIEVYKNGNITQRASDIGYVLLGTDFDGAVGLHGFSIDTNDNSDAGFWVDGAWYFVLIDAITVDGQIVRFTYYLTLGYLLRPTTVGRKLDVSTGGEAGVDWANVGSPTTVVGLSGTTVKTATDVETDTQDIQARLPAALGANGNMKADVRDYNAVAGTFAAGRPEVNTSHAAGTAWNSGAIGAATLATDTITAAKIAPDAIGSSELASGAVTKIIDGWANYDATQNSQNGSLLDYMQIIKDAVETEIATILSRLPAALTANGMMKVSLQEILTTLLTETSTGLLAAAFKKFFDKAAPTGTINSFPDAVPDAAGGLPVTGTRLNAIPWNSSWDAEVQSEAQDAITASGLSTLTQSDIRTATGLASANLDTQLNALPTATENADAVWEEPSTEHTTLFTMGGHMDEFFNAFIALDTLLNTVSTNITTVINRIGAFTGTGVNTVLGFLRALLRKDASLTPSDVGGTFDNTTDSQESNSEAIAALPTAASITTAVWAAGTRTLTGFGSLVSDVSTAVWAAGTRTLTSFGSLVSDTVTAVWAAGTRTLTAFSFTVNTNANATELSILSRIPAAGFVEASVNDVSATTLTFIGASSLPTTDDYFVDEVIIFTSGALQGVTRRLPAGTYVGSTRRFTFAAGKALPVAPTNGTTFMITGRIEEEV